MKKVVRVVRYQCSECGTDYASSTEAKRCKRNSPPDLARDWSPPIKFVTRRTKLLKDVTAADVPPGLDPEDVAIDCPPK